ncbi:phage tail protein (plasmid) [Clostridium perfringens]
MELLNSELGIVKTISNYQEKCIESFLDYPYSVLNLYIQEEDIEDGYIKDDQIYYIDSITEYNNCNKIKCLLDLSEIESIYFEKFESGYKTIDEIFQMLLLDTEWSFKKSNLTKKRKMITYNLNGLDIIKKICEKFNVKVKFDNVRHIIELVENNFSNFSMSDNNILKKNNDTKKIVTKLIPKGNNLDICSVNNNLNYIENNTYSQKKFTALWQDDTYDNAQDLLEDAKYRLSQVCKPKRTYVIKGSLHIGDSFLYKKENYYVVQSFEYSKNNENNFFIATNNLLNIETSSDKIKEILNFIRLKQKKIDKLIVNEIYSNYICSNKIESKSNDGNYSFISGRDIVINGQRAIVGTDDAVISPLQANKVYINYNNDFKNGVEIGGVITNNNLPILSMKNLILSDEGYIELNNGLVMQCGSIKDIPIQEGSIVDTLIKYKKKFAHKCIFFMVSIDSVDNDNWLASNFSCVSRKNGQETGWFYSKNLTPNKKGNLMDVNYIAIGY